MSTDLTEYIERRKELNAVILAHYYQRRRYRMPQILWAIRCSWLSGRQYEAEVIVFWCYFYGRKRKILNPDKIVILPELQAGCPMADMATGGPPAKGRNAGVKVVCYVNLGRG